MDFFGKPDKFLGIFEPWIFKETQDFRLKLSFVFFS